MDNRYRILISGTRAGDEVDPWGDSFGAKRVSDVEVNQIIRRNEWRTDTVYDEFVDVDDPGDYVGHERFVFKCLDNAGGAPSTVAPTPPQVPWLPVRTSDGYLWKYMYEIEATNRFLVEDPFDPEVGWYPVRTVDNDVEETDQRIIQDNAVNGAVEAIVVTDSSSDYLTASGTVMSGTTSSSIVLEEDPGAVTDYAIHFLISDTVGGQSGIIDSVSGNVVVLQTALSVNPDPTTTYVILPRIVIDRGRGGTGATARPVLDANGGISWVDVITHGSDYEDNVRARVRPTNPNGNATLEARIGPPGGHGSDAVAELGQDVVMVSSDLGSPTSDDDETVAPRTTFRQVSLVRNPETQEGISDKLETFDTSTRLSVNSEGIPMRSSGDESFWTPGALVEGPSSEATGYVVDFTATDEEWTTGTLRLNGVTGTFTTEDVLTTTTGRVIAAVTAVTEPDIVHGSGDTILSEAVDPIQRDPSQTERFRIVARF